MNIFLSYGHDDYDKFAHRLKSDLETQGFKVWMDIDGIRETDDWEKNIEDGINGSDWFVIMMTQHSCRRPDGVCLDEVSYARFLGKSIAPIMIENVKPPLCIARIQYIDMENYFQPGRVGFEEESYQKKLKTLIDVLQGVNNLSREGEYEILSNRLVPLDNDVYYEHFRHNFYGRKKLFEYYTEWIKGNSNLLWIIGNAGVGKTSFIAKLAENNETIKAVHFCRYNDNDRANPKRAIMSIAYYLSTQLEEYKHLLLELNDLDRLQDKSAERLFTYLLVEPLNKISKKTETTVIVIDALDEATSDDRNELADIIASKHMILPCWMKIVVTSRDEPILRRKLSRIAPINFEDSRFADNTGDIYGYFDMRLGKKLGDDKNSIISVLVEKSSGNFLYAKTVADDILAGILSIQNYKEFPNGLTGVYTAFFDRLIKNSKCDYRRDIRPVLELLCAEYSPLDSDKILRILGIDEYDFDDIKEDIAQMFPEKNSVIEPVHKSIVDWLVDREKSGIYRVSLNKGHNKLANYCIEMISKGHIDEYVLKYSVRHLINSQLYCEAIELLNRKDFQDKRIEKLGLDTALREYLYEIESLLSVNVDIVNEIYKKSVFLQYFCLYRTFLYNTGLYFQLKDNRFDDVINDIRLLIDLEGRVGVANYLYITERFDEAIKVIDELFHCEADLSPDILIELHNIYALCYRKYVDFDVAKEHFEISLEYSTENNEYNKSISAVNLGKIAYHELDWDLAHMWNDKALGLLHCAYNKTDSEDMKINIELFIAEYHRLIAECLIWKFNIAEAEEHLKITRGIYAKISSRDRYYVRYIYTSAFAKIFDNNPNECIALCNQACELATSLYDWSQIMFYRGLALLKLKKCEDAVKCLRIGAQNAEQIGAWLELEEILLALNENGNNVHSERFFENSYIHKWSDYAYEAIKKVVN